jgi:dienelactone hydrolase
VPASVPSVRRSRLLVALVVVALVAGATASAILLPHPGRSRHDTGNGTTATILPKTTTGSSRTTVPPPVGAIGTYGVATDSLLVTVPGLGPTDDRLATTVWYPVTKPTSRPTSRPTSTSGRAPRRRYPLLVFSEGFAQPVSAYARLLTDWASAGFVVAGPTYPHTAPSTPTTLDRADLVRHPADLRSVVTTLLKLGTSRGSVLSGRIDVSEVGLVGQSDGGDVSLAVADNSCCRYAGVKAVAVLSGAEYAPFGGRYFAPGTDTGPPLLVVQGGEDPVNPPVCSEELYDAARPPKYYLDLLGATHLGPYTEPSSYESVVAEVTTEFFDAELAGQPAALTHMTSSGDVPNVAALTGAATAPFASGTCPTAP